MLAASRARLFRSPRMAAALAMSGASQRSVSYAGTRSRRMPQAAAVPLAEALRGEEFEGPGGQQVLDGEDPPEVLQGSRA